MYTGRVGTGVLLFFFIIGGYMLFIVPGLVIHLISIFEAASYAKNGPAATGSLRPRTPAEIAELRERQHKLFLRVGVVAVILAAVCLVALFFRYQEQRGHEQNMRDRERLMPHRSPSPTAP